MFKILCFLITIMLHPFVMQAQFFTSTNPFAHTFSIVAWDENTGEMAVGVQSHWFAVGTAVSWGEAGVGVVATQSFTNKSFGPEGLRLLREGKTPADALKILLDQDEGREYRQVSIMDNKGNVATHTGASCIAEAGHIEGEGFSVQANMMLNATVWDAMAKAYSSSKDLPLPERVLITLEAAQEAGGDIRGKQSAAILVVKGNREEEAWEDPYLDIRVDDNQAPLEELRRLLKVFRAYEHMNKGDLALEVNDMKTALAEYNTAQEMFPDNLEMKYWTAITLINNGELEKVKELLKRVFHADDHWRILTERLPAAGLLQVDDAVLQSLLAL